ncbi:hypothetical protein Tco_0735050 [Tanacetum coccineum]
MSSATELTSRTLTSVFIMGGSNPTPSAFVSSTYTSVETKVTASHSSFTHADATSITTGSPPVWNEVTNGMDGSSADKCTPSNTFTATGPHGNFHNVTSIKYDFIPSKDSSIVRSVSINTKPSSYAGATGASAPEPIKVKANFRSLDYEDICDGVELTIPSNVVDMVSTRLENTLYGYLIGSFTSSMCIDSWGWSSFARCLIEIKADTVLKDSVTIGIPLPDGLGFTKETVLVEYEWKPPRWNNVRFLVMFMIKALRMQRLSLLLIILIMGSKGGQQEENW